MCPSLDITVGTLCWMKKTKPELQDATLVKEEDVLETSNMFELWSSSGLLKVFLGGV